MARISIRVFVDDAELDRAEADLPSEAAREIIDDCKQTLEEHRPPRKRRKPPRPLPSVLTGRADPRGAAAIAGEAQAR